MSKIVSNCHNCYFLGTEFGCPTNRKIHCYNTESRWYGRNIGNISNVDGTFDTLDNEKDCFEINPNPKKYKDAYYYIYKQRGK